MAKLLLGVQVSSSVYEFVVCVKTAAAASSSSWVSTVKTAHLQRLPTETSQPLPQCCTQCTLCMFTKHAEVVNTALAEAYLIPAPRYMCLCVCTSSISSMRLASVLGPKLCRTRKTTMDLTWNASIMGDTLRLQNLL